MTTVILRSAAANGHDALYLYADESSLNLNVQCDVTSSAIRFLLILVPGSTPANCYNILTGDGAYSIYVNSSGGLALISNPVNGTPDDGAALFHFNSLGTPGQFGIQEQSSKNFMNISGNSYPPGTPVILFPWDGNPNSIWQMDVAS